MSNLDSSTPQPIVPAKSPPGWWLFLKKFLQRGRTIASFAPSSSYMVRSMLRGIDFASCEYVVELGGGTGPVTAELLRRAGNRCKVLIVELDPDLCQHLRQRFPEADIVEADAIELDKLLADRGVTKVDHILSGLPLPSIPEPARTGILKLAGQCLKPGGTFRQLTIMPLIYRGLYRKHFESVQFQFVPLNLPPGGVYICREPRNQQPDNSPH
jgi:phospholipid N-methyltransferase